MPAVAEFIGVYREGRFSEAGKIRTLLAYLEGKRLKLSIAVLNPKRSLNQNAYYWGVVVPAVRHMFLECGNDITTDEVHEYLKQHVGGLERTITLPDGRRRVVVGSTAGLSKLEMEEYLEKVRAWASQFGVVIPLPNEELTASPAQGYHLSAGVGGAASVGMGLPVR